MSKIKTWRDRVPKETTSFDYPRACREAADAEINELRAKLAALEGQEPVAWWIPKAEQFCLSSKDGSRPFAKAWEPLFPAAGAREAQPMTDTVAQVAGYASPPLVLSVALCAEDIKAIYAWRTAIEAHLKGARE